MLQCLAQLCISILQLLEQSHVLDGDHRLVGEGLEQSNLLVRERPDLHTANAYYPDWYALAQQRCGKHRSVAHVMGLAFGVIRCDLSEVRNMNCLFINYRSGLGRVPI